MAINLDDATQFLPKYLSPASREELFSELKHLPRIRQFFAHIADPNPYQGDGWRGVHIVNVATLQKRPTFAMVVSNTCDMSPENERKWEASITLAPIVRLSRFVEVLRSERVAQASIDDTLKEIRAQEVSRIFYLPRSGQLDDEYLAFLDQPQAQTMSCFAENAAKDHVFRLSQAAFWLLLLKLSIHFCRANEGVDRGHA